MTVIFKKRENKLFEPPVGGLGGNVRTPFIARWKARGRLSLFIIIKLFSLKWLK